ncbi:hypothetical protein EGW08_004874 [Elysia chlorotica]|uniref:Cortactin-binding protein 2 n=1 Tax=Elysia chlorotica TaxID=188477 RepID=A0A3S1BS01_ELYCH|nr:hypothetical protein EGW08_004874 [Elysia chlorotica]
MAARNLKPGSVQGYQSETDKAQPSTLKRQPNPDWSKNDLLRLLSYFEGELQARDITIATLKAEKAKQLLYQAKYGRFGLGDPFVALQRDAEGKNDTGFDEAAIKSMYDNQLAQLENLIATQRKAQLKMREQLVNSEKRFHKVCSELEDEKKKHAHDTAQGDDVTYMLEKERERLKAEIDFEKSQNKKLEKDLKKTLASLEEERANAARHKQVAIMLIKERKNLIERLVAENQLRDDMESALTDGKSRMQSMAEGLAEESKKSLKMEAALERQNQKFDGERESLKVRLQEEEKMTGFLRSEVTRLSQQLETIQQQARGGGPAGSVGMSPATSNSNQHLRASSSSPARVASPVRGGGPSPASSQSLGVLSPAGAASPYVVSSVAPASLPRAATFVEVNSAPAVEPGPSLEFLGPEMANLQQILATMTTGSTSASSSAAVSNPTQGIGGLVSSQSLHIATSSVSVQSTVSSPKSALKGLTSYNNHGQARLPEHSLSPSSEIPSSLTSTSAPSNTLSSTIESSGRRRIALNLPAASGLSSTMETKPASFRICPSPLAGSGQSVPLHIYEDHSTATPSTYMIHHIPSSTSVTPASPQSAQPNVSLAWPSTPRTSGQAQPSASPVNIPPQSSAVITSQPLPSATIRGGRLPSPASAGVAVGVVAPTVSPRLGKETIQKQAWATTVFPGSVQSVKGPPLITSTATSPEGTQVSQAVVQHSSPAVKSGSAVKLTVPDIIKQVCSSPEPTTQDTQKSLSPSPPPTDLELYPVHKACVKGDTAGLQSLLKNNTVNSNLALKDGSTPVHCAVEYNQEGCLKLLLENGSKPSSFQDDRTTPLHIAASKGHMGCLRLLLAKGAAVNLANAAYLTPLLMAVKSGHTQCCQILLRHGANVLFAGQDGLSSIHHAVQAGHLDTLRTLLDRLKLAGITRDSDTAHQLVAVTDHSGWTLAHMAAHLPTQDCLVMLSESLPLDFDATDKLGRTVREVASKPCKEILGDFGRPSSPTLKVAVELRYILENTTVSNVKMGSMLVAPGVGWRVMEERLRATLLGYLAQLDMGLRTRRIARMEAEAAEKDKTIGADRDFTLGLTMANIKQFEMGFYKWTPGMQTDTSPYLILCNNEHKKVTITVDDSDFMCELIAFDVLHPVSSINNYLRLMEQYRSVIFYGPAGSGKSYLAHKLAQSIAAQEITKGRKPSIYQLTLQSGFTYSKFLAFLKQRNCVVPVNKEDSGVAPILLLDNLETVDMSQLFGELLDPMEYRGIGHAFCLRGDDRGNNGMHYLTDQFYVIGTMNKARSLGVDLNILPRFRWVQFRLDTEPLRGLLARHFLRRLCNLYSGSLPVSSSVEEEGSAKNNAKEGSGPVVLRAVEWVVCVWQRLNDSLLKLGLPEVVLGPCTFFRCPLERRDPSVILEWMKTTWNQMIAPRVREAVKRGTGSEAASEGQQKVANTALYVLMQRSVILGCPLAGQEKDAYLAGFAGSNELDIPLRQSGGGGGGGYVKTRASLLSGSSTPLSSIRQSRSASGGLQRRTEGGSQSPARLSSTPHRARSVEATESHSGVTASSPRVRQRNGLEEKDLAESNSNIKRRSLSDSSVDKAVKQEQQKQQQEVLDRLNHASPSSSLTAKSPNASLTAKSPNAHQSQAKVARLDVKPVINLSSALVTPQAWDVSPRTATSSPAVRKTGRVSPLLALVSAQHRQGGSPVAASAASGYKKSRSSENISGRVAASPSGRRGFSPGPFSFSLTTPTSNLNSFKFLEKSSGASNKSDMKAIEAKREGKMSLALADMAIPDFSVFDKVPTPTEERPKNRSFVFIGRPSPKVLKANVQGSVLKRETDGGQEEVWSRIPQQEVWSKRTDGFVPIDKQDD